ncbi:hypothetical protein ACJ5NV_11030 [Loktanella agnita]|uniref:hypothetical protein n=1 Tax=Loktanella agnita TaxID=287097 RepID=UPI003985AD41
MSIEISEIRQLRYPILAISQTGVERIKSSHRFDFAAREFYANGEGDDDVLFDAAGKRYSIVATRLFDLPPMHRFLQRSGDFFIGNEWKMVVRCEMDCKLEEKLSFEQFCARVLDILLAHKEWWYDLSEHELRTIFDGCRDIKDAMAAVEIVGEDYHPKPDQKSKICQDLTVLQKLLLV